MAIFKKIQLSCVNSNKNISLWKGLKTLNIIIVKTLKMVVLNTTPNSDPLLQQLPLVFYMLSCLRVSNAFTGFAYSKISIEYQA